MDIRIKLICNYIQSYMYVIYQKIFLSSYFQFQSLRLFKTFKISTFNFIGIKKTKIIYKNERLLKKIFYLYYLIYLFKLFFIKVIIFSYVFYFIIVKVLYLITTSYYYLNTSIILSLSQTLIQFMMFKRIFHTKFLHVSLNFRLEDY